MTSLAGRSRDDRELAPSGERRGAVREAEPGSTGRGWTAADTTSSRAS